jgi:hypothetical protein
MPEIINWSFSVDVDQGPRLSGSDAVTVGAYDKASVVLSAGAAAVDVDVQPANAAGKVHVLVVRSSVFDRAITLSADAGTTTFALEGPVVLIGSGAVRMLADAPRTLRFGNSTGADVTVDVLVGRDPAP